jgi:hypothetical protein
MQATVELPETVLRELETLAQRQGTTTTDLIQRIVEAHLASSQSEGDRGFMVSLPLIPVSETGPIEPVSGANVDELLSRDYFPA